MKELSIKEKAQAYDKALEGIEDYIKSLKNVNDGIWSARDIENSLSEIFPQLKESEDEMIRKALIRYHKSTIDIDGIKGDEIVSWLEKQSKQKSAVETKLKIEEGKWYVCISQFCNCIEGRAYKATSDSRIMDDFGTEYDMHSDAYKYFRLWTIQDAKEGDVLVSTWKGHSYIYIFKEIESNAIVSYIYYYPKLDAIDVGVINMDNTPTIPATKEQHDLLFQKMKEAGYKWDVEKKKLKEIEQKSADKFEPKFKAGDKVLVDGKIYTIKLVNEDNYIVDENGRDVQEHFSYTKDWKLYEQNPAWSEEDEMIYQSIMDDTVQENQLDDKQILWLKSLKERVQPTKEQL